MLQHFSFCPCFGNRSHDDTEPDRDPVLSVSGIAGSIIHSKKNGSETRVWVRLLLANLEFKKKIWSIYNPKTGIYCVLYSLKSLLDHARHLFMRIPVVIISYRDLSLLNVQAKSKAFVCGGGGVNFHKKMGEVNTNL